MGVRFAFGGGRESRIRTLLTAVGVGVGVALLLLTAAVPTVLAHRHDRERARNAGTTAPRSGADTLLMAYADTTYRDAEVAGRLVRPEGAHPPLPPGLDRLPAPGTMVVSPALDRLLKSPRGELLRARLAHRVTGTIGKDGLVEPQELLYYAGSSDLTAAADVDRVDRLRSFGSKDPGGLADPSLFLLVVVVFVTLLTPVAVFVAAAVRFGGDRRDRRLAALRLLGASAAMTRRVAAGEALGGALAGLAFGALVFALGRGFAERITFLPVGVFTGDLTPVSSLAALIAVAVPLAAVAVTLFSLRSVAIEPLGVVRAARPSRRRLRWRLLLPLGGFGLLWTELDRGRDRGTYDAALVVPGTVLALLGVTVLLPWVVEAVVGRLGAGPPSWQLAVRRIQLHSGTAARTVNGVAVAVAGAIALQMLLTGLTDAYTTRTGNDLSRARLEVALPAGRSPADAAERLVAGGGARAATALSEGTLRLDPGDRFSGTDLAVGDCGALREVAVLPDCREGDVFVVQDAPRDPGVRPGAALHLTGPRGSGTSFTWRIPRRMKEAHGRPDPGGTTRSGLLATPAAVPRETTAALTGRIFVALDPARTDAQERVRNSVAAVDPLADVRVLTTRTKSPQLDAITTGLAAGVTCVLLLIGASLLISQLEQLRERRSTLSALVAFGTPRRTLGLSVLWQTVLPVGLGVALAGLVGVGTGAVLLRMSGRPAHVDWGFVGAMAGISVSAVLLVTLLALPPLVRMMRPDGLHTE